MNQVEIARTAGLVSFLLFLIVSAPVGWVDLLWYKAGRTAFQWMIIYFFFLFILRALSYFEFATQPQLQIISGYATVIPLLGLLAELWVKRHIKSSSEIIESLVKRELEMQGVNKK